MMGIPVRETLADDWENDIPRPQHPASGWRSTKHKGDLESEGIMRSPGKIPSMGRFCRVYRGFLKKTYVPHLIIHFWDFEWNKPSSELGYHHDWLKAPNMGWTRESASHVLKSSPKDVVTCGSFERHLPDRKRVIKVELEMNFMIFYGKVELFSWFPENYLPGILAAEKGGYV